MQTKIYSLIIAIICIANATYSQTIKCLLKDKNTKEALSYASISTCDFSINYVADENGVFEISKNIITKNDTLIVRRLGYEFLKITLIDLKTEECIFYLNPIETNLAEVTVLSTNKTWGEIMYNALQTLSYKSLTAFESEFKRSIKINCNAVEVFSLKGEGYFHDEGFDGEQLIKNRQRYSWAVYNTLNVIKKSTENIKDHSGHSQIHCETDFETRAIKFIFPLSIKHYNYKLLGIELLDKDTVYKIEATPNEDHESFLKSVDRKMFYSLYSFIPANKTYYIHTKTYEFVRIAFNYNLVRSIGDKGVKLKKIYGYCDFVTKNKSIHPTFINVSHDYENKDTKQYYTREDKITFSNIKRETLSNDALLKKYKLETIKNDFPGRTIRQDYQLYFNPNSFFHAHGIKPE